MRQLHLSENPVQAAYNGGDQVSIRALQSFHTAAAGNFSEIERTINTLESTTASLHHKIDACYQFISWVQEHAPETLTAYKAHNTVLDAFDKAEKPNEWMYPQAETSA